MHRQVRIEHLRLNPYTLHAAASGVHISDPSGKSVFASIDRVYVSFKMFASIFRRAIVLNAARIDGPT